MTSPPLFDLDSLTGALLAPDPNPSLVFREVKGKFDELIREERPEDFPHGDPRHDAPKKADWNGVIHLAKQSLTARVKDLRIASWLTVGLVEVHRFPGLRDGLRLLHLIVDRCWDSLLPSGKSPHERADALTNLLDDPDTGLALPAKVRCLPIINGLNSDYGFLHYRHGSDDALTVDPEDLKTAIARATAEQCQALAEDLSDCVAELDQLKAALLARSPDVNAGFGQLRKAIEDCQKWVAELLQAKVPRNGSVGQQSALPSAVAHNGRIGSAAGDATTREQAYQQLRDVAKVLERLEPSSPVQRLVEMAVKVAGLPFPKMMKALKEAQLIGALVQDNDVLEEVMRKLSSSS